MVPTPNAQVVFEPNAKINLGLFIKGKRPDGYHNLETAFIPVDLADRLTLTALEPGQPTTLQQTGLQLDATPKTNLAYKAWALLRQTYGPMVGPVHLQLEKRIPAGAGLGGGSSDAAFALLGLNTLFGLGLPYTELHRLAALLGSDVPFFLLNRPVLAHGVGDQFEPFPLPSFPYEVRVETSPWHSDTAQAYRELNLARCNTDRTLREVLMQDPQTWRQDLVNDFEPGVFERFPELAEIKQRLYDEGAIYAGMSGSGTAVYGLFPKPQPQAH